MSDNIRITGKYLNELWNVGAEHALYHHDSNWYHILEKFPGALFDPNGYVLFTTEEEYRNCKYLRLGKHLSVPDGIYAIPSYILTVKDDSKLSQVLAIKEPKPVWGAKNSQRKTIKGNNITADHTEAVVSDLGEPEPSRVKSTTYRILRNTVLAKSVKEVHDYECQICGLTIELQNGQRYAEAHHIKPLGTPHNGPDIAENIICVCPNHHVQLDYMAIPLDTLFSSHKIKGHQIGEEFIKYHNELVQLQNV